MLGNFFRRKRAQQGGDGVSVNLMPIGGPPELKFLFIDAASNDVHRMLDGWKWLGLDGLTAIAVSAFGEVFFRAEDGAIQHLDMVEGRLSMVAASLASLTADLQDADRRDELLLAGLVIGARNKGLILAAGECYDFAVAPILGGEMSLDQVQKISFVVKGHIAGQIHEQVKDLPPGTPVKNITISD